MLLRHVVAEPTFARRYMERYVNNGSPSGFTQKYTSSEETSPFNAVDSFRLWAASVEDSSIEDMGQLPSWLGRGEIPLHPDMVTDPVIVDSARKIYVTDLKVTPTASARTVEMLDPVHSGFVKLAYNRLLGRVNRKLTRSHAAAALDVTSILCAALKRETLPRLFSFFAESGARVASLDVGGDVHEWGTVFRDVAPQPLQTETAFLIPSFSLFAIDQNCPSDPPLLTQLAALHSISAEDFVYENVLRPIVTCYFELLLTCALQFECNAQNLVLGFDRGGGITTVAFRDFESVDKDLSLAEDLDLKLTFSSYPFKCVHRGLYNYSIKHSFMFDFKLGEYVLSPVISTLGDIAARMRVTRRLKKLTSFYIGRLPADFFPSDGQWYSYANVVVDKTSKRPYVGFPDPRYR